MPREDLPCNLVIYGRTDKVHPPEHIHKDHPLHTGFVVVEEESGGSDGGRTNYGKSVLLIKRLKGHVLI